MTIIFSQKNKRSFEETKMRAVITRVLMDSDGEEASKIEYKNL